MSKYLLLVSSLALALLLTSCGARKAITAADFPGTWVPGKESEHFLKPKIRSSCRVTFYADGRFQGNVPFLVDVASCDEQIAKLDVLEGRWSLTKMDGDTVLELDIPKGGGRDIQNYVTLNLETSGREVYIVDFPGDPDSGGIYFERVSRETPKP